MERRRFLAIFGGLSSGLASRTAFAETEELPQVDPLETFPTTPEERINFVFDRDPTPSEVEDVKFVLWQEAVMNGENPQRWLDRARCESEFKPKAVNGWSGAMGILQFIPDTWNRAVARYIVVYGPQTLHPFNPVHNIRVGIFWKKITNEKQWSC
ncbi:MAG: lytic transglycosylase domain-containing protein [Patescibacteria group bacterium]